MKKLASFIAILGGLLLITAYQSSCTSRQSQATRIPTAVDQHGWLRIQDGKMVDENGVAPQLRGISFSWSIWEGRKYYNADVIDWMVDDFQVDLLRFSMAIEPDSGYLDSPDKQKDLITSMIDHAIDRGVYVLIDWHDHHANDNIDEAKDFFDEMAQRYKNVPNVLYEIWNEPEEHSWTEIKAYSEELIKTIRVHDQKNLIVIPSARWDQDVDVTAKDPITSDGQLIYSFHFYASDPWHQENLRKKAEEAMQAGLPIIVSEWGVSESNGDGDFNTEATNRWVKWMNEHQLSWANWNITDKDETSALLKPGAPIDAHWQANELTEAGNYIREVLRTDAPTSPEGVNKAQQVEDSLTNEKELVN